MKLFKKDNLISGEENIHINEYVTNSCEKHTHDFFEIVYIRSGSCVHCIDDIAYKTGHGDLVFINRGQTHSYKADDSVKMVNILINPEFISNELIGEEDIVALFQHSMFAEFYGTARSPKQYVHFKGEEHAETDALISMLIREYARKERGYKSILQGGVRILFSKLLRGISAPEKDAEAQPKELFEHILNYIDENYNRKISISELALRSFYNPVYFGELLKKYCGKSFSAYLKEKRISKAAELLKAGNKSIEEIMEETGYSDKKRFYAHFKEIYNITPAQYRNL